MSQKKAASKKKPPEDAVELAACYFCKKLVNKEEHLCHGCGQVICEGYDCNRNMNMPWGSHRVEQHQEDNDEEDDNATW